MNLWFAGRNTSDLFNCRTLEKVAQTYQMFCSGAEVERNEASNLSKQLLNNTFYFC